MKLSMSMKRATIMFTRPNVGRAVIQEVEGRVDRNLRNAIEKAYEVFWREFLPAKRPREKKADKDAR